MKERFNNVLKRFSNFMKDNTVNQAVHPKVEQVWLVLRTKMENTIKKIKTKFRSLHLFSNQFQSPWQQIIP
jgi:hypothetical protein